MAVLVDNFQLTLYATHGESKETKTVKVEDDEDRLSECKFQFHMYVSSVSQNTQVMFVGVVALHY